LKKLKTHASKISSKTNLLYSVAFLYFRIFNQNISTKIYDPFHQKFGIIKTLEMVSHLADVQVLIRTSTHAYSAVDRGEQIPAKKI